MMLASPTPITEKTNELITQILQKYQLFLCENNHLIRSQFCSCHDSSAAMACAKLRPDWINRIKIRTKTNRIFVRFQLWAPKPQNVCRGLSKKCLYIKELLNVHFSINYISLTVWVRYFMWSFKGYFGIPHKYLIQTEIPIRHKKRRFNSIKQFKGHFNIW